LNRFNSKSSRSKPTAAAAEEDDDEKPLDFSHLVRTTLWYCRKRGAPCLHRLSIYRRFALRDAFDAAEQRFFSDHEANEDALFLFKAAVTNIHEDGDPNSRSNIESHRGLSSEDLRFANAAYRAEAIVWTVQNPAVAEYVSREKVQILSDMLRLKEGFVSG